MRVFLSYASEDRPIAEQIQLALAGDKNKVFFDSQSLVPGGDYNAHILKAIKDSDAFIFLISKYSIEKGCYCLTELNFARGKWPHPKDRVIPVMLSHVEFEQIPNYLRAVTVYQPEGNIPAEVLSIVLNIKASRIIAKKRGLILAGLGSSLMAFLFAVLFLSLRSEQWETMGVAITGEKVSVDSKSIKGSPGKRGFTYKIGNEVVAAVADCGSKRWFAKGYSKWVEPQSKATKDMIAFVCN